MKGKGMALSLSAFGLALYFAVVIFSMFGIIKIDTLANFSTSVVFEAIGAVLLIYFIFSSQLQKPIKVGYLVPLIMITVIYTIELDVINIIYVASISSMFFILINLILLFVYCLLTIPMYIIGRR